jgi:hypothetical protein
MTGRKKARAEEIAFNELSRKINLALEQAGHRILGNAIKRGLASIKPSTRCVTIPKRPKKKKARTKKVDFNMPLCTPEDCMRYASAIREVLSKGGTRF